MEEIRDVIGRLVKAVPLDLQVDITAHDESIEVNVTGKDRAYLITDNGETLLSLQYLLSRIVRRVCKGEECPRVLVDSDGFLFRRDEHLRTLAGRTIRQVRREKRRVKLRFMNPYERRIIHMEIAAMEDLDSVSEGEGFFKQIVVRPRK